MHCQLCHVSNYADNYARNEKNNMRILKHLSACFTITFAIASSLFTPPLFAQDITSLRGSWIADIQGERHVLYLVLRDNKVSGTLCFDCYNPDNLAFVDDGTLDNQGLHFNLYHSSTHAAPYIEKVDARLQNGSLHLSRQKPGAAATDMIMQREVKPTEPPAPVPVVLRPNLPAGSAQRMLPAPAQTVTADKVLGMWLWGIGPGKQYFFFKAHKDGVRGMVCGPCDSAINFAPLENISMNGTNFHFDIVHEDNGGGFEEHGPFSNVTDAQITMNEMHLTTYPSFDTNARTIQMSLLGPVQFMARAKP